MNMRFADMSDSVRNQPWHLWMRQILTIARIDLRKSFFTRRGIWIYVLAFAPVAIIATHALIDHHKDMADDTSVLAGIFQFYYLRLAIYFGCIGIFTRLVRGEMIQRSLHFYLLAPVRREVIVLGKFLAGATTAILFFGLAISGSFWLMYLGHGGAGVQYVFDGPGLGQFGTYLGIAVLACIGYGALILALSMVFKNPIVSGILLLGWEGINPVLPQLLQKFSIIFYLRHLAPVEVQADGIFRVLTVVAEPVPAWAAVVGVLCVSSAVLLFACLSARRLEINYTTD